MNAIISAFMVKGQFVQVSYWIGFDKVYSIDNGKPTNGLSLDWDEVQSEFQRLLDQINDHPYLVQQLTNEDNIFETVAHDWYMAATGRNKIYECSFDERAYLNFHSQLNMLDHPYGQA